MWKFFTVFILAVLDLLYGLRITGNRCAVISPVFLLHTPFSLKPEELHLCFFGDGLEKFCASLGRNILPERMFMERSPFLEAEKRVLVLQNEIIGDGKDLFIGMRKAGFQIC